MKSKKIVGFTITAVTAALLVACGGSDGGTSNNALGGVTTTATNTLQGTAATGAAFEGATITVTDKTGAVVGTSSVVGADGTFSITISASAVAPFVLTASRTTADGVVETLVSVVPTGTGTTSTATVNVSQVTNLIASRLSASGDPSQLAAELAAGTSTINATTVAAKVNEVQTILAPILAAAGATATDPLTGTFAVGGAGYDHFLDSIKVTLTPATATSTNIEIGVKQQTADDVAPTVIAFTNQTTTANVPVLPAITASSLVPSGTSALISAHLAQLTSCYSLPTTTRVNSVVSGGVATGTVGNVVASACTSAFLGNSPASFKSNGVTVGRDANNNGAFASLFRDGATGVVFSQGTYEFTRNNGDIVAGYKSRDTLGNEAFDTFVLRLDTDGKLKQIGNQYIYGGGVMPYQQLREFVQQPAQSYYSTGYNINIPNIPGITYVDVTAPNGNHMTLIPGSDGMVLPKKGSSSPLVASGTTFVRIRSEYVASTGAPASHPSALEPGLVFVGTDFTEDQVAGIPNQGVWTIGYYSGGTNNATGGTLLGAQSYKTRTRANTIAELRKQGMANLSAASIADMVSRYQVNTGTTTSYASLPAAISMAPTWEVPSGTLPPTQIKLFGTALYYDYASSPPSTKTGGTGFTSTTNTVGYVSGRTNFSDGQTVGSSVRTASIACANGTIDSNNMGEKHCANPAGYLASSRQTGFHLRAADASGREYVHFYVPYTLQ